MRVMRSVWNRIRRLWWARPTVVAYGVMALLIVCMTAAAYGSGFHTGLGANLLLNGAGDLVGGAVLVALIEPLVSRASERVRPLGSLDFARYVELVGRATEEILILDTSTRIFTAPDSEEVGRLVEAVRRGAKARVLLMMPNTTTVELRKSQLFLRHEDLNLNQEIRRNISAFSEVERRVAALTDTRGSFELRLYDAAIPFTLYTQDNRVLFGLIPATTYTFQAAQLEFNGPSPTRDQIRMRFNELWDTGRPVRQTKTVWLGENPRPVHYNYVMYRSYEYLAYPYDGRELAKGESLPCYLADDKGTRRDEMFNISAVDPTSSLYEDLSEEYKAKYTSRTEDLRFYQLNPAGSQPLPVETLAIRQQLPAGEIVDGLAHAVRRIRILDTSSGLIGDDCDTVQAERFREAALAACANGAAVRILLMEPTNDAARVRGNQIHRDLDDSIRRNVEHLRRLMTEVQRVYGEEGERLLQVRFYNQHPDMCVHQVDDLVYVGFLDRVEIRTSEAPQLEVHRASDLGNYAVVVFGRLWTRARPLAGMRYVEMARAGARPSGPLFIRAWSVEGHWYVASHRIEEQLQSPRHQDLTLTMEDDPANGTRPLYTLSAPITPADGPSAWRSFTELYGATDPGPGVYIRRLIPPPTPAGAEGADGTKGTKNTDGPNTPGDDEDVRKLWPRRLLGN